MGKSVRKPVTPEDTLNNNGGSNNGGDPLAMSIFGSATKAGETQSVPDTILKGYDFNPHSSEFEYIPYATPATTNTDYFNSLRQSNWDKFTRGTKQFGANVASSIGQGLANTFDLASLAKTIKGEITGSDDEFQSSLFGLTTKEMADWAQGVAARNKVHEDNPGDFNPGDFGWWMNQFAQSGTGIGMAIEALGTTAAIEGLTGGVGTAAALGKLGSLFNRITKGAKGLEIMNDAVSISKGLRSAATLYGTISRYSESRMEAQQSFDQIYNDLSNMKNEDGTDKFSEEEKRYIASEGGRATFNLNMLLLPLDILSYRTMVFNPISGSGTGLIEKGLGKIGNKWLRRAVQGTTLATLEGTEEGFQFVVGEEGKHYAQVLAGMDDGSSFVSRLGKNVQEDEFWNNFAGGVIGSPIIAGAMKVANKAMVGNRSSMINEIHRNYVENIGKMDNAVAEQIKTLENEGRIKEASVLRRKFGANKALSALHLDAMTDKDIAYDSYMSFLDEVLNELSAGKTDALQDLGFTNTTPEQIQKIIEEFNQYKKDALEMGTIYNNIKDKYNKNFVPEIAQEHFQLNKLLEVQQEINNYYTTTQGTLYQYGNLSTTGKEIYNMEYTLDALSNERKRLTEQYRNEQDDLKKQNIQQVIDETESKIENLKTRLKEISNAETYSQEDRKIDNAILSSALRDDYYSRLTNQHEQLTNMISLQRKNISLWNNPKFQEAKATQSIKKAKTKAQVESTQQANPNNQNIQQAAIEKKEEIDAKAAAEVIRQQQEQKDSAANNSTIPGNANLFDEDNGIIDTIKDTVNVNSKPFDDEGLNNQQPEFLFVPATYDFNRSPEDAKNKVINGVRGLLDRLGKDNSFENLVRHVIKVQGEEVADNVFNALKYGWEANGLEAVDYDAIYNKIFGNPMEEFIAGAKGLTIQDSEELEKETGKITGKIESESGQPEFDNNNQPIHIYKGIVTNEASPKFAFITRLSKLIRNFFKGENGEDVVEVSHEYTEEELNIGDYVDSLQLLDPDKFNEGTELIIRVPNNYLDIKIPVYNSDGTKGKAMTFGQYVAQRNLSPEDQEYQDKIPMIIYEKGRAKGLAFVHDIGWYHPLRFNQERKGDMEEAISRTREIRTAVLADQNNSTPIIITGKRQTTFSGLKTKQIRPGVYETVSLKEANPETQLTVALTSDSLSTSKRNTVFPNNSTILINNSPFKVGQVMEVRRFGMKDGKKSFIALPVLRPKLDDVSKNSVLNAIFIYSNRANPNPDIRTRHDRIAKQINDSMGLDILNPQGLEKYLNHFITTFNTEKAKSNQDVEAQAKAKLPYKTPYIAFIAGGNIVFGKAGEHAYLDRATGVKKYSFFINPNMTAPAMSAINNLAKPSMIGWYEQNLDLDNLNRNKPVVTIAKDGTVTTSANSYNDFLLERFQTNIKSYNIGTDEKPNYVTNIQPVITYELKSKLTKTIPTNEEVKKEIINNEPEQKGKGDTNTNLSEVERAILEQAKRDLGKDFGISNSNNLFLPTALSEEQRQEVAESINRIAGLTPDQQYDIVDFMYNQIITIINPDGQQVTKYATDKAVTKAFNDIVIPLKEYYREQMAKINQVLSANPNSTLNSVLNDYAYRVNKIEAIEKNMNVLKEEAYNRVAKFTGITKDTVIVDDSLEEELFEDDLDEQAYMESMEENPNQKEKDFWTDVLTESPENKLSYSMRRFFGAVREYNKDGTPATGFLGLPTYVGADTVVRTLMVTLADIPSDFDMMMDKLESIKTSVPWMQEVIDKLKGTSLQHKNQFVTLMSNSPLRMKFTMISYNRRSGTWTTKVYNTNMNGVADSVKQQWRSGFYGTDLVTPLEEGGYTINKTKAKELINEFESWQGLDLKKVEIDLTPYRTTVVDKVKVDKPTTFRPTGEVLKWLSENVSRPGDRARFSMKNQEFQVTNLGDNLYEISYLKVGLPNKDSANKWLEQFGVKLSPNSLDELMTRGLFHNYQLRKPNDLFTTDNGLFQILYKRLNSLIENPDDHDIVENVDGPLDNSVINSLANLESKYNHDNIPFGFRDNGKSLFALTAPKFITDRIRNLKMLDSQVRDELLSLSFSQQSLWLKLLSDDKFRDTFQVSHLGLNAFKELGKKLYRDNQISRLADVDHELTKLGMFWDITQGEVSYIDSEGKEKKTYPDTNVGLRMATMFSPTMSDKSLMTVITTAVLNLQNKDLLNGQNISDEVVNILYDQLVRPELKRMVNFHQKVGITNIKDYDKGASMFLLLPELNNIEYTPGLKLTAAIRREPNYFTLSYIEGNEDIMSRIKSLIKGYVNNLTEEKIEVWKNNGMVSSLENNNTAIKFFDKKYLDKFTGNNTQKVRMAAMDFVVNSLIANANSFMVIAGDPALYYKSKSNDPIQAAKDTFVNVGKRLANQIAPGTILANSENEKYIQVFLKDRTSLPEIPFLKFVTRINDGNEITDGEIEILRSGSKSEIQNLVDKYPVSSGYFGIEGSDAQEYTTWKEHLDILSKLGRTPDTLIDITPEEIEQARELFSSDIKRSELTEKQEQLIAKIMQPIKPVYTGQIYDAQQDVMRTVYIKSSSFPLIPQLTAGMEIDKLREALEKVESKTKMNVRASYQSANKVGAVTNPILLWNEDGNINQQSLDDMLAFPIEDIGKDTITPMLILDRKNFRIQQEVPFKSGKTGKDKISLGTQLMKLLFGDQIMELDGFVYNGHSYTGSQLHEKYNQLFDKLVLEKRSQLFKELGLNERGVPIDVAKSTKELQRILKDEAVKRGYPLQDIEGLTLNKDGTFELPLWASSNSNRYESMLNSIVTNRIIRMKFPGNSFVVGSEEGFRLQDNLTDINKSKIIWTSAWNGKNLQAAYYSNGELKKAQVLVSSKFKDSEGNLIDLFEKENGEYKYITKSDTGFYLKQDMFEKELLSLISFRIPTSGHQSASVIEIAGFLPAESADLMIVPRNFTKQKGLDFDIDKENTYALWNYVDENGKYHVLKESHRSNLLAQADKYIQSIRQGQTAEDKLLNAIFGDETVYTAEDIKGESFLEKLNSEITEKILQNEIIKINHAVMGSNNPKVQAKINKTLNTDYAEKQADFIDDLINIDQDSTYWTPLSDEYQKQKLISGSSGKIGTGAYSLDVVGHSLFQQAAMSGKPLQLIERLERDRKDGLPGFEIEIKNKEWRFGNIQSDGQLGRVMTLDGGRSISEVMSERQNIAVDNEKLQVMGRVGLNEITMDVDKVMNMLGFDKGSDGNSISFLFLSQPIIREYVNKMRNANSNVAEYEADKEDRVVNELLLKYDPKAPEINDEYWQKMSGMMTNENFITAIRADKPDGALQGAILRRFLEMKDYGIAIRGIQTSINTDSKGLGKSFFDVIEKRNALNRLGSDSDKIVGASNLIGTYIPVEELDTDERERLTSQGYVNIGKYYVKPNTLSGSFNIYGVATAYNLWSRYFPYDAQVTNKAMTELLGIIGNDNMSDSKIINLKQDIFRGMKKYFAASKYSGIINETDSINNERMRLYIDSAENISLAKYIKTLRETVGNPVIDTFIKTNKLINRFEFDIKKNGQPSLIKYNNAAGEEFDEQYLYESLATLLEVRNNGERIKLPKIGNKEYTLDTLAQDLIAYAYLGNAIQEAIQFTKYVPMSYLNTVGFSEKMRAAGLWLQTNPNILGAKIGNQETDKHLVSEFAMQYVQHNPEKVKYKLDSKNFSKDTVKIDNNSFVLKNGDTPSFISVYDAAIPKGEKKFRLYWYDGEKFTRIPVLGAFGMDEYQPRNSIGTSIVNGKLKIKPEPQQATNQDSSNVNQDDLFNISSGDIYKIIKSIADTDTTRHAEIANHLLPYAANVKIEVSDSIPNAIDYDGVYDVDNRIIYIHPSILNDSRKLAYTVIHEFTHHLTIQAIKNNVLVNELTGRVELKENTPAYITDIVRMYHNYRDVVGEDNIISFKGKLLKGETISTDERSKYYGGTNIYEFVAMAMGDAGFQKILNKIPYQKSGQTFLQRFKEIIVNILKGIGVQFDENFTASHAISAIFETIDKSNLKVDENPWQGMWDETMNFDQSQMPPDWFDENLDGNTEFQALPAVNDFINTLEKNC